MLQKRVVIKINLLLHQGVIACLLVSDTNRYGRSYCRSLLERWHAGLGSVSPLLDLLYSKNCPDAVAVVEQASAQAGQQKAGIWSNSQFVTPLEWRYTNK